MGSENINKDLCCLCQDCVSTNDIQSAKASNKILGKHLILFKDAEAVLTDGLIGFN